MQAPRSGDCPLGLRVFLHSMQPTPTAAPSPHLRHAPPVGTSNPVSETSPVESEPSAPPREFFSRARTPPPKRRWRFLWAVLIGVGIYLALKAIFAPYIGVRAATPDGLITLKPDMSREVVDRAFGGPLAKVSTGADGECLLYGQPAVRSEPFSIFRVCYRDGRIVEVSERSYEGYGVSPEGEIQIPSDGASQGSGETVPPAGTLELEPAPGATTGQ